MEQYETELPTGNIEQTNAPVVPSSQQQPPQHQVSPPAAVENAAVRKEENVEYRDQDGNLLDAAQVEALKGKVSFNTRYETRTRLVDAAGDKVEEGPIGGADGGVAPPHPDVERLPSTGSEGEDSSRDSPATASVEEDVVKEKSVEDQAQKGKPKPASEGNQATVKEEL